MRQRSQPRAPQLYPEHDLFIQSMKLKNTLRWLMGEELVTHLSVEYYDWDVPRLIGEVGASQNPVAAAPAPDNQAEIFVPAMGGVI